ncbi:MAG: hypothetical protein LBS18_01780 [Clostridiales bacterium]|jgi:hypothetical protein|nr:hypothetical protein [Clostridiales bacterium]
MRIKRLFSAFIIMILIAAAGCAGQSQPPAATAGPVTPGRGASTPVPGISPEDGDIYRADAYIKLAQDYFDAGDRTHALQTLHTAVTRFAFSYADTQKLYRYWWRFMMEGDAETQELTLAETILLDDLATLTLGMDCFFFTDSLAKTALIKPLQNYFIYGNDAFLYYPADSFDSATHTSLVSSQLANRMTYDMFGVNIPGANENLIIEDQVVCQAGTYYLPADYSYEGAAAVYNYAYLGNDTFYLACVSSLTPKQDGDAQNTHEYLLLLVRRANTPWGFRVISKLKEGDATLLEADWAKPANMVAANHVSEEWERKAVMEEYIWHMLVKSEFKKEQPLTEAEQRQISEIALLAMGVDRYFIDPPTRDGMLGALSIMFRFGGDPPEKYSADIYNDYGSILTDVRLNEITNALFGMGIAGSRQSYTAADGAVIYNDGLFSVAKRNYTLPNMIVTDYAYMQNDIYYVVVCADFSASNGAMLMDYMRLLVRRSDSAWGFMLLSKLKENTDTALVETWRMPQPLITVAPPTPAPSPTATPAPTPAENKPLITPAPMRMAY